MNRIYVILNPAADRGRAGAKEGELREVFRQLGVDYVLWRTEHPGQAMELARQALREGAECVAAAGGDGTANEVAQALVGKDVPLGIIPLGSGNDYIHTLGIPRESAKAVELLVRGRAKPMDVGRVADRFYLNSLGMGLDGQIAVDYKHMRLLKGELGYLWAALLEVIRFRSFHGELEIDNQAQGGKIVMISVMNGPYAGGGFHLAPGARADDGKINVVTIGDYPRISRFPVLLKTRKGTHPGLKRVQMRLAATVRIQTDRPVPVHMDGELLPMMSELSIEVCPRAIRVIS